MENRHTSAIERATASPTPHPCQRRTVRPGVDIHRTDLGGRRSERHFRVQAGAMRWWVCGGVVEEGWPGTVVKRGTYLDQCHIVQSLAAALAMKNRESAAWAQKPGCQARVRCQQLLVLTSTTQGSQWGREDTDTGTTILCIPSHPSSQLTSHGRPQTVVKRTRQQPRLACRCGTAAGDGAAGAGAGAAEGQPGLPHMLRHLRSPGHPDVRALVYVRAVGACLAWHEGGRRAARGSIQVPRHR